MSWSNCYWYDFNRRESRATTLALLAIVDAARYTRCAWFCVAKLEPLSLACSIWCETSGSLYAGCVITIRNRCSYSVTACAQSGSGPVSRYNVGAGGSQAMNFGSSCSWPDGIIFPSVGGQCTDRNLANIAEFTLGGFANSDYYDLSNIVCARSPLYLQELVL